MDSSKQTTVLILLVCALTVTKTAKEPNAEENKRDPNVENRFGAFDLDEILSLLFPNQGTNFPQQNNNFPNIPPVFNPGILQTHQTFLPNAGQGNSEQFSNFQNTDSGHSPINNIPSQTFPNQHFPREPINGGISRTGSNQQSTLDSTPPQMSENFPTNQQQGQTSTNSEQFPSNQFPNFGPQQQSDIRNPTLTQNKPQNFPNLSTLFSNKPTQFGNKEQNPNIPSQVENQGQFSNGQGQLSGQFQNQWNFPINHDHFENQQHPQQEKPSNQQGQFQNQGQFSNPRQVSNQGQQFHQHQLPNQQECFQKQGQFSIPGQLSQSQQFHQQQFPNQQGQFQNQGQISNPDLFPQDQQTTQQQFPNQNQQDDNEPTFILGKPVIVPTTQIPDDIVIFEDSPPDTPVQRQCVQDCQSTSEFKPICGTNNVTYFNPAKFLCARKCGERVFIRSQGRCPQDIPYLHGLGQAATST